MGDGIDPRGKGGFFLVVGIEGCLHLEKDLRGNVLGICLTFKQKLSRLNTERKERLKDIIKILEEKVELTKRESKSGITFKHGRKPMAKLAIKGKSVYAYLAIGVEEQLLNKIGGKDVSSVKKYKDYPVECKITSNRKAKNVIQIIKTKI